MSKLGMFLAVSILMLHSFMPHEHHNEISEERHFLEHKEARTLLDYLLLAFHSNPGESHLEEFQKAQGVTLNITLAASPAIEFDQEWIIGEEQTWSEVSFFDNYLLLSNQYRFRGPPQLG